MGAKARKSSKLILHPDATKSERRCVERQDKWRESSGYIMGAGALAAIGMLVAFIVQARHWHIVVYLFGSAFLAALIVFAYGTGWPWLNRELMIFSGRAFWLPQEFWDRYMEQTDRIRRFQDADLRKWRTVNLYVALRDMSQLHDRLAPPVPCGSRRIGGVSNVTLRQRIDSRWDRYLDPL